MHNKDWISKVQELANSESPMEAFQLFMQHKDEAVDLLFGEKSSDMAQSVDSGSFFEQDTREIAQLVARWSAYAAPLDADVLSLTVDVSRPGETPLIIARTEEGDVVLFDTDEASRANEEHLEDCRHVEASWCDWQGRGDFLPLFCGALAEALTRFGLPEPRFIR